MNWVYTGRCWKFGDKVGIDGDMMPLEFALTRETNPDVLREHLMTGLDPNFPKKVSPGDLIVAGKRFAQGNPHIQGLIGVAAHRLGLVVESIPRGSLRNVINVGVPILPRCPGVSGMVSDGDELEVDFQSGRFVNRTRGVEHTFEALESSLLDIIAVGGWRPMVRQRLAAMNAVSGDG